MPVTYDSIASTTLTATANTITFSSIAGTYTDLRLVISGKVTNSVAPSFRFNSDTGTNYSSTQIKGSGTAASSTRATTQAQTLLSISDNWSATEMNFATIDIFNYAGSTFKSSLTTNNQDYNGSGSVIYVVNLWRSTAAITSIEFKAETDTFTAGTTASLYGITKA